MMTEPARPWDDPRFFNAGNVRINLWHVASLERMTLGVRVTLSDGSVIAITGDAAAQLWDQAARFDIDCKPAAAE